LPYPAIAFDVTPLQNAHRYRGIGTYVRGLAQRLVDQTDIPIEFWGWADDEPFDAPPPHRELWLPRFPMPRYRAAWFFAQTAMRRRARQSKVAAVHVTDPDALTPLKGKDLLATVYDLIPLREGVSPRRVFAWAGYRAYLRALRRVDSLFAISSETAKDVVELLHVEPDRVVIVPPGIDLMPPRGGAVESSGPYFLFIGGPNPNKNLSVLLDALALIPDVPAELRITGHWLPKQVEALNARLATMGLSGRAHHMGFVPSGDLPGLMRQATAVVVPSLSEGFGLPVGEGLAAGALVIHSAIPVLEATSAGAAMTFNPRSAAELAACMRRAATDPGAQGLFRTRGVRRARELTWDAGVERTLAAYRALLHVVASR
jgi:glycosyltransferase involved in cell wall biosynthesis